MPILPVLPVNVIRATLTLGTAVVDTNINVFRDIDGALLFWYDPRDLRIIHATYPHQISSVSCSSTASVDAEEQQIKEGL
ncbi:hypothetical protein E2C01_101553 [Portunus trituberculatus]|uniref:Uncharacterized protein n=1 Tax=Portunus trituberculatus TaxID=210409 RepID=A0A5B7KKA7_PORTR|nr:hypothetical protein [Portunus trituberculatus]